MHRKLALLVLLLISAVPVAGGADEDWPQWRGPGGRGVAAASGLPTEWDADSVNVRWQTEIRGEGISSPVTSAGRVFVTAAWEGGRQRERFLAAAVIGLALALLLVVALRPAAGARRPRLATALAVVFLLLAIAITLRPELFYETGNPGRVWRTTGALGLLGVAVAFGWFRPGSRWRLAAVVAALAGAAFIALEMPPRPLGPVPWEKRLTFVLPGLVAAFVYARNYFRARSQPPSSPAPAISPAVSAQWPAWLLLTLALAVFVPPNYLGGLVRGVVCVDLASGEVLWEKAAFAAPAEQKWPRSSWATPTPAADDELVFAYFGAGLAAFDLDGRMRWVQRFPTYSRHTRYGTGTSPVLTDEAVLIVQESEMYQGGPPSWIEAFDKRTGRSLWRLAPDDARDSYNTPLLVDAGAGEQLITASWQIIVAYDAASGERLWSVPTPQHQVVASMAHDDALIAVSGGVYGDQAVIVTRLPQGADDAPEVLWRSTRGVATISSPVFYAGMLFTVTDGGIMTAYEAVSGAQLWKGRLRGEHYSSLVAGDGKIFAVNTEGATSVVAASPDFEVLAVNELGEAVYSSPAVADGCLLIRGSDSLFCVEGEPQASAAVAAP